jgi:transmembrane sensor
VTAKETDSVWEEHMREEAAAWLTRLRGAPTAEDQIAFEEWYSADPGHAAAYDAVLETWSLVGQAARPNRSTVRPRRRRHYGLAAVAATIVIAFLAYAAFAGDSMSRGSDRAVELASRTGEIRPLQLADGSRVILDTATLLQTDYSADVRRITLLQGRARFLVARDKGRPFIVATTAGLVVAHGAVFDVALVGPRTTVSPIEGSLEVRPVATADPRRPSRSTRLVPGQRAVLVDGEIDKEPVQSVRPGADWPNGMLSFEDAPLDQVVAAANRYSAVQIVLADPTVVSLRFTGTFKATDTEQLANLLAAMFSLDLTRGNDRMFVLRSSPAPDNRGRKKIPG